MEIPEATEVVHARYLVPAWPVKVAGTAAEINPPPRQASCVPTMAVPALGAHSKSGIPHRIKAGARRSDHTGPLRSSRGAVSPATTIATP